MRGSDIEWQSVPTQDGGEGERASGNLKAPRLRQLVLLVAVVKNESALREKVKMATARA